VKRIAVLAAMLGILLVVFGLSERSGFHAPPAEAAETTVTLFYGNGADGTIGPIAGNGGADENLLALTIPPFCTDCYITRIEPDMVYWNDPNPALTNGMIANYNGNNA
jgi:hypothetical protein